MGIIDQHIRARQLHEMLTGRQVTGFETTPHLDTQLRIHFTYLGEIDLVGRTVESASVQNELLELHFSGGAHMVWAGPETLYHALPETLPKAYGLKLTFDDGSLLTIHIPGMAGCLGVLSQAEYEGGKMQQTIRARERFSVLDEAAYTFEVFKDRLTRKNTIVCSAFIDFTDFGYLPDALFEAKINPRTKVKALSDDDLFRLFTAVRSVTRQTLEAGGEALEKDVYGRPGGYRRKMAGHLSRRPCPACGTIVQKQTSVTGMGFYFCPQCQPFKEM